MSSMNHQEYYENSENWGSYQFETLEQMVNNFLSNYCGDGTMLSKIPRTQVLYHFKKGIQKLNFNALKETKAVELELNDTLDIIIPHDYINYTRISWVHPETGDLMPMSVNNRMPLGNANLQDHNAELLFDQDGFILEGTTYFAELNDKPNQEKDIFKALVLGCGVSCNGCQYYNSGCLNPTLWGLDTTKNANGTFNIDERQGRIHFSSDNATRVIMLEYISDGLQYLNESDIKVNKLAEDALYCYVNHQLINVRPNTPLYDKQYAKKAWDTAYRNCKIALFNIKISDTMLVLNAKRKWLK